ncbi:MAG: hypothetical protein CSA32_04375 [Desulfobulbus propionicus]|nr:MAG: hypothetical protein CSA32_04375 [Desulfobulbus propionicus]
MAGKQGIKRFSAVLTAGCLAMYAGNIQVIAAEEGQTGLLQLVPERDIVAFSETVPLWKAMWDEARELSRNQQYDKAVTVYTALLNKKPNLDEARWELTAVLLHLKEWQQAEKELNILLAQGEGKSKYLLCQAEIALQAGNSEQAVIQYRKLAAMQLPSSLQDKVLDGLARSLAAQKKFQQALAFANSLLVKYPDNIRYLEMTAMLSYQAGELDRAFYLLQRAHLKNRRNTRILTALAQVAYRLGREQEAGVCWQRLVELDKENILAHKALAEHYKGCGNHDMELHHLENVQRYADDVPVSFLLRMVMLYLDKGRNDKAMSICNILVKQEPDNVEMQKLYQLALRQFAEEMLALVENSGSRLLWDDLSQFTDNRLEIFRSMADMLRKKKNFAELADMLLVAAADIPEDDPLLKELKTLLKTQERTRELVILRSLE